MNDTLDTKLMGTRIRQLRKQHHFTQAMLAARLRKQLPRLSLPQNTISQYETGAVTPPTAVLTALAVALETSLEYLVGKTPDPTPTKQGLTPDPEFWRAVRELNGQPPKLKRLAAQYIEAALTYAREYAEWRRVSSSPPETQGRDADAGPSPVESAELSLDLAYASNLAPAPGHNAAEGLSFLLDADAEVSPDADAEQWEEGRQSGTEAPPLA